MSGASALGDHVDTVTLIDHHAHGCWLQSGDRRRFENGLNEANVEPLADFDSAFDSQLGFAVRAHCGPLLGLSRHAGPDAYWERRIGHSEPDLTATCGDLLASAPAADTLQGRHTRTRRTSKWRST